MSYSPVPQQYVSPLQALAQRSNSRDIGEEGMISSSSNDTLVCRDDSASELGGGPMQAVTSNPNNHAGATFVQAMPANLSNRASAEVASAVPKNATHRVVISPSQTATGNHGTHRAVIGPAQDVLANHDPYLSGAGTMQAATANHVNHLAFPQSSADCSFVPEPRNLILMHTVSHQLPASVTRLLGPLSPEQRDQDLARWAEKIKHTPLKTLKPLAKEMVYHVRNGNRKSISIHGTKDKIANRLLSYGFKFLQQMESRFNAAAGNNGPTESRAERSVEGEAGAVVISLDEVNGEETQHIQSANNISGAYQGRHLGSNARELAQREACEAATNENFISALSANEICRALHALCAPESMAAAGKVFQDSSRQQLDACLSEGLTPVDAGWLFVANLFNSDAFVPKNVRAFDVELAHIDPSRKENPRGSDSIKTAISTLRTSYHEAERKFSKSGNNDAEFFSYCNGSSVLIYCHHLLKKAPHVQSAFPRALPRNTGLSTGGDAPLPFRPRRERRSNSDDETVLLPPKPKKMSSKAEFGMALKEHTESVITFRQSQLEKTNDLKERELELRRKDSEAREERNRARIDKDAGETLRALNDSAEAISEQIAKHETALEDTTLSEQRRARMETRRKLLVNSLDQVNRLIINRPLSQLLHTSLYISCNG